MSSGAYRVKFEIEYPHATTDPPQDPDPATWKRWKSYLLVEMAPLDLMPHTVNLFLKQVHHGLWDGTHVTMNERRVLRIGPRYDDDAIIDDGHKSYRHFLVKGLNKVSYQEYSPEYPHEQFTVGMAGRHSGPDFYINKTDNTRMHGPGGGTNDGEIRNNEADPCFGRLVDGSRPYIDILSAIDRVPENSRQYPKSEVFIRSAKVLIRRNDGRWRSVERDNIVPLPV